MSTSVQGAAMRSQLGYHSFTHITTAPVAQGGITPEGVLFDGVLTDAQVVAVWEFLTSRDDADQSSRSNLADRHAAAVAAPADVAAHHALTVALAAYVLNR